MFEVLNYSSAPLHFKGKYCTFTARHLTAAAITGYLQIKILHAKHDLFIEYVALHFS